MSVIPKTKIWVFFQELDLIQSFREIKTRGFKRHFITEIPTSPKTIATIKFSYFEIKSF